MTSRGVIESVATLPCWQHITCKDALDVLGSASVRLDVAFEDNEDLEANALRALFRVYLNSSTPKGNHGQPAPRCLLSL